MMAMEIARWVIPFAVALVLLGALGYARRRARLARAIGDPDLLARLMGDDIRRPPFLRLGLAVGGALSLAAAFVLAPLPTMGNPGRAGPVVIAFDVSNSMLTRDVAPSRIEQGRAAARVIASESGAAVGIVAFAGGGYVLTPPTTDPTAVELYFDALHPGIVTQTGSSLSAAIRQALGLLVTDERRGGAVVLISDGDSEEPNDSITTAIDLARRVGVAIHVIATGTSGGGPVPVDSAALAESVRAPDAASEPPPVSRLDEPRLRRIAAGTGGIYVPAEEAAVIGAALAGDGIPHGDRLPVHLWLVALAGGLLLVEVALARTSGGSAQRRISSQAMGAILIPATLIACSPSPDPADAFAAGDFTSAAAGYRALVAAHPGSAPMHYNLGATLLRSGEYIAARTHLEEAARGDNARIRRAAWYNIGNTHLEPVVAGRSPDRMNELSRAIVAYKYALLFDPSDHDARWNLELARRLMDDPATDPPDPQPEPAGGSGGGGGDSGDDGMADVDRGDSPQAPRPASGSGRAPVLTPAEADELLDDASQRETAIQREKLARPQPPVVSH